MLIIDRYVFRLFAKVLVVCFISLAGLFVIIDAFGNLDEFLTHSRERGELIAILFDYYGARVLSFFDRTSGLLALIATMFVVTWLQRSNELTALMAAGISKARIIRPLIGGVIAVSVLGVMDRELMIPAVREKLARNAQDLSGEMAKQLRPRYDNKTDILIGGEHTFAADRRIERPVFQLPPSLGSFARQIIAEQAVYHAPRQKRPGGYLLNGVRQPTDIAERPSAVVNQSAVILTPLDTDWLKPDQCFVVSDLDFELLSGGSSWRQHSSTAELIAGLRNPSLDFGADVRLAIHARIVQPLLDITLLFLGLPLVLNRESRNIFVAAGLCLAIVSGFYTVLLACHALGNHYLISPALSAWCPLMIFVPIAVTLAQPLRE